MRKTVVLMASPRLQSNTDILANRIIDGIRSVGSSEDVLDKIDLVEMQEFVCCACGQCRAAGECLQFPEVTEILEITFKKVCPVVRRIGTLSGESAMRVSTENANHCPNDRRLEAIEPPVEIVPILAMVGV